MSMVTVINHGKHPQIVTVVGVQGPQGRPGDAGGSGQGVKRLAGSSVSALRVVWEDTSGHVWPLSASDSAHIDLCAGITLTAAASAGDEVVLMRAGVLDASGLALSPGRVWLGQDGQLTQVPPASGCDVLVGYALAHNRLLLAFESVVLL